jgi:hypothetical protein
MFQHSDILGTGGLQLFTDTCQGINREGCNGIDPVLQVSAGVVLSRMHVSRV